MLLLVGYGGMAVFTTLLTIFMPQTKATENAVEVSDPDGGMNALAIGSVVSLLGYTAFYAVGPEMFATAPRAAATSVLTGVNRFGSLFIALTFPYIQTSIEEYTFIIFVAFLALIILFTQVFLIETKGKTTEEIQRELRRKMT
ncbi:hypothetical protein RvY_16933 [Ramazzottius varieornatus]|uniref:Major facilitator superfamily (MFS) profile domain-containing protein n=1 Tax=Ramazzottius varieornatus TaxID=947166 RepID=A0A1D1W0A4_RAMVA|nr:hypothetical protein RvY_16933 [Ramazzottius varieornatus]